MRSRLRAWLGVVAVATMLAAGSADARNGGIYLELAPSWGFYMTDEVITEDGDDGGPDTPQGGFVPQLKLGFTLFGLVGAEMDVAAHGWDIDQVERGGGGFVGGVIRAQPLEVLSYVMPDDLKLPALLNGPVKFRDRPFDIGMYIGGGYTIVGEDYAYQGSYLKWGFDAKWYVTPNFAVGIDLPVRNTIFQPFRYTNYSDSLGLCTDGADAYGQGGIVIPPNPTRVPALEFNASQMDAECTDDAPVATFFAPSLTIAGVFDFGI
jgi:hypothetical protein